jgi:hypothetical protein
LISLDESGNPVSPFEAAGLKNLTADMSSSASDALKARAWMGGFFMAGTDMSAVAPFGWVSLQPSDTLEVDGYSKSSFAFTRTTAAAKQSTSVTAACNAAAAQQQTTVDESFELSIADLLAEEVERRTDSTEDAILDEWNTALKNTGDAGAVVNVSVSGVRGTTFRSALSGTATVALDGTTVGTGTLTLPTESGPMVASANVSLGESLALTKTSKLTVAVTGTVSLSCDNAISTSRTIAVKPGLPQLVLQVKQSQ